MARGIIRYWAAAREAAGVNEEAYEADTLAEAIAASGAKHGARMESLAARCTFIVDSEAVGRADPASVPLTEGGTIEVLPPFAGGSSDTMPRWLCS